MLRKLFFLFYSVENTPETEYVRCTLNGLCNVWSFAACINHLCNHKSNAVWMHKTVESRLSFRCTRVVLLSHIFNFDFMIHSFRAFFFRILANTHEEDGNEIVARFQLFLLVISRFVRAYVYFFFLEMINCDSYLQLAMLHFDFVLNLIDYELRTNIRQRHFHVVNVPPENL